MKTVEIKIIKTEEQFNKYLKRLEEIFDAEIGTPESEEADLLALVIGHYDDKHYPIVGIDGGITKKDGSGFSQEEYEKLYEAIMDTMESQKCIFGGGVDLLEETDETDETKH